MIIPGSKSTRGDLAFLRAQGWDGDLIAHVRRGGRVLGLCGGYQMLGRRISDPKGIEGSPGETRGLGLLDVETVMTPDKRLERVKGAHKETGAALEGYEIHIGRTAGPDCARPFARLSDATDEHDDGAVSADGRIAGTYLHGAFVADGFRRAYLAALGAPPSTLEYDAVVEHTLDMLADHLEAHLSVDRMLALARAGR